MNDLILKRLFKGFFHFRPPRPRYNNTWDPSIALSHLESLYPDETLSAEEHVYQSGMFTRVIDRLQGSNPLINSRRSIKFREGKVENSIPYRVKTSAANRDQPTLILPFLGSVRKFL